MVYGSQQIQAFIQPSADLNNTGKKKVLPTDPFSEYLSKSMQTKKTQPHTVQRVQNTEEIKVTPLQSDRIEGVIRERDQGTSPGERMDVQRESTAVMEKETGQQEPVTRLSDEISSELPVDEDPAEQVEKLQGVMDEIMALLQQIAGALSEENPEDSVAESMQTLGSLELPELVQSLEDSLAEVLTTANGLEGTKTADSAQDFVNRLQQLLGKDFRQFILQNEGQITVQNLGKLENLIQKMLYETENAKMHITQQSIGEILIPAMKEKPTEPIAAPEGIIESPDPETVSGTTVKAIQPRENQEFSDGQMQEDPKAEGKDEKGIVNRASWTKQEPVEFILKPEAEQLLRDTLPQTPVDEVIPATTDRSSIPAKTEIVQQVMEKAEAMFSENKSEVVMQLKPESLGKISLRVIQERGEIVARFVAENEQVKQILESNMQMLKDSLQKNGVSVQSLSVSVGQQGQRQEAGTEDRGNEGTASRRRDVAEVNPMAAVQQTYLYRGLAGETVQTGGSEINLTA